MARIGRWGSIDTKSITTPTEGKSIRYFGLGNYFLFKDRETGLEVVGKGNPQVRDIEATLDNGVLRWRGKHVNSIKQLNDKIGGAFEIYSVTLNDKAIVPKRTSVEHVMRLIGLTRS